MLQQNDIDALLAAFAATQDGLEEAPAGKQRLSEVKIYDFAQPDNLPSEFVRALENVNASFARAMAGMLSGYLSMGVLVEPLSTDQLTYRQFCNSVPETTVIGTFTLTPLEGMALFELNPHIAWYLIERGLGGKAEIAEEAPEFTPLERGLLDELVFRRVMREIGRAWKPLAPLRPTFREVMTNPAMARIAQPDDRMVVCSFSISMSDMTGMCAYCLPVSSLDFERLLTPGSSWEEDGNDQNDEVELAHLLQNLLQVPLPLRACLPDVSLTLGELMALHEGDVIHLDTEVADPVELRICATRKFFATPVTLRDTVGIEIVDQIPEEYYA